MGKNILLIASFALLLTVSTVSASDYTFLTLSFPPLEQEGADHKAEGAVVEIVNRIMTTLGHQVKIQVLPWTRALQMVRNGKADAIFTAYKTPEREEFLDYSHEVLIPQAVFFYKKKGSDIDYDGSVASIQDKIIGVVSTISYGRIFEGYKGGLHLDKANMLEHNFQKLLMGRIELVPSNMYVAEYTLQKLGLADQIVRLPYMIESIPSYIAFTKAHDLRALREQFDYELHRIKASGEYSEVLKKYGIHLHE